MLRRWTMWFFTIMRLSKRPKAYAIELDSGNENRYKNRYISEFQRLAEDFYGN